MKHLKTYENNKTLNIGDYVLCKDDFNLTAEFVENNIGQYIEFDNFPTYGGCHYLIKYENIPDDILIYFAGGGPSSDNHNTPGIRPMSFNEIIYHAKDIEELKIKITSKKYNL